MRIAYIAPYQGPHLTENRPILRNFSIAGNVKIELITEFLIRSGHEVEIFSQGEVIENQIKFFPQLKETKSFNSNVPISYASALPIRRLNGHWSSLRTRALFESRHKAAPFDLVIIYNLKPPQILCGSHALTKLALPVILEYEDDAFVDVSGKREHNSDLNWHLRSAQQLLRSISGCIGVSPYLLTRSPAEIPKLLLRGVVSEKYHEIGSRALESRKNRVVFSGTHVRGKGLEQLIDAWKMVSLPGWELHITGHGVETNALKERARNCNTIVFRGLLSPDDYSRCIGEAKIGINPHDISSVPGNVFAFKIIEYLAAGNHVLTTPMGPIEPELEAGITYMSNNLPETIASTLTRVIQDGSYDRKANSAANRRYGPVEASQALDALVKEVVDRSSSKQFASVPGPLLTGS